MPIVKWFFGLRRLQLFVNALHHTGGEFFRRQSIASADNAGHIAVAFHEGRDNILVERFAGASRLFGPVQDCDRTRRFGERADECFN